MSATLAEPRADRFEIAGLASVATISFLASRAVPTAGFFVALAGGAALARAAQLAGARRGYGASLAATLESIAILGPIRFGVPLTQAITAPMVGRLHARGAALAWQALACAAIRMLHNAATATFVIFVIAGIDAYTGTYDTLLGRLGLPEGQTAALFATLVVLVGWGVFASVVQVLVYRRALMTWDEPPEGPAAEGAPAAAPEAAAPRRRFDPRACALAAAVSFGLLVASTDPLLLAATTAWLAAATALARGDSSPWRTGAALAAVLAGGALVAGLVGGQGAEAALERAWRAALLVLTAAWLRAAAGSEGLRDVSHRALDRLRRVPTVPEAAATLDGLGSDRRLAGAGRSLLGALEPVERKALPLVDAVLGWAREWSRRFRPDPPVAQLALRFRARDAALVAAAAGPVALLVG